MQRKNDFKEIEFMGQGNVQEKIDNEMKDEIKMLDELKNIQVKVEDITDDFSSMDDSERENCRNRLNGFLDDLNTVHLNIVLNGKINNEISKKLVNLQNHK